MINYKWANNWQWTLLNPITAIWTTMVLSSWQWDRFPSVYPYLLTIKKIVAWSVTQREMIKVTNKSWDIFTIVRSAWTCLPNDSSDTQWTTAFAFDPDDNVSMTIPYEIIEDIYSWILDRLLKSWDYMTWLFWLAESSNIASATPALSAANWNTVHITWTTTITSFWTLPAWVVMNLIFDWALTLTHNATSLILPTAANILTAAWDTAIFESKWSWNWVCLNYQRKSWQALDNSTNISSLTEDTVWDMTADYLVKYDTVNKKIKVNKYMATDAEATAWLIETKFINPKQIPWKYISSATVTKTSDSTWSWTWVTLVAIPSNAKIWVVNIESLRDGNICYSNSWVIYLDWSWITSITAQANSWTTEYFWTLYKSWSNILITWDIWIDTSPIDTLTFTIDFRT